VHDVSAHPNAVNLALLVGRVWLAVMIFAHGWNHLRRTVRHQGVAEWFDSLGVRPGRMHAWTVTLTELAVAGLLAAGLLTPIAYGGLCALMLVAFATAHRTNGFFIFRPGQGWEYVVTVAFVSIALGPLGPGKWSLDDAFDLSFPFDARKALIITVAVGLGGAALFLLTFWRPPRAPEAEADAAVKAAS
jgi:putative oxidoreductase